MRANSRFRNERPFEAKRKLPIKNRNPPAARLPHACYKSRARPLLGTFVQMCANAGELNAAFEAVVRVQDLMSPRRNGSDVWRVNAGALRAPVRVDAWTFEVLSNAREIWELSGGLFDVTREGRLGEVELLPRSRVRFRAPVTIDRVSGAALLALNAVLVVTGYALYYAGGETLREWSSAIHIGLGVVLPFAIVVHILLGRRTRHRHIQRPL